MAMVGRYKAEYEAKKHWWSFDQYRGHATTTAGSGTDAVIGVKDALWYRGFKHFTFLGVQRVSGDSN